MWIGKGLPAQESGADGHGVGGRGGSVAHRIGEAVAAIRIGAGHIAEAAVRIDGDGAFGCLSSKTIDDCLSLGIDCRG